MDDNFLSVSHRGRLSDNDVTNTKEMYEVEIPQNAKTKN